VFPSSCHCQVLLKKQQQTVGYALPRSRLLRAGRFDTGLLCLELPHGYFLFINPLALEIDI